MHLKHKEASKEFIKDRHALMEGIVGFHLRMLFGMSHNTKSGILDIWLELEEPAMD